ncbi:nickel pincer cofactor biosynthesis protein LarC [Paractinoplanes ferrugineus]|uniref:Pyridinium-3,5-bisthiocarboxylic acid mononucleotide nickel insertion protein n=1 Tax=Paractinoplanes ferrugineus TaxID=113564 RepID=A0A919MC30_9ACTN|nr:nickel pincer cofactor biosynthesis protein LarC [Actinoplanes ferrugineus]GIE10323.1 UPF0272 protein Cgl2470/cg2715 [Actinoplanes ferrugineus]
MTGSRIGWIDASGGVSGDMLLGACFDAGVDPAVAQRAVDALGLPEPVRISAEPARRRGLGATRAVVSVAASSVHRTLGDVLALLEPLGEPLRGRAAAVFRALAEAEGRVHRIAPAEVHFHEVGALDAIADVVGGLAAFGHLGLDRVVCGPIALGNGQARSAHGPIPVPGPAVLELLRQRDAPAFSGTSMMELATPTGVALLTVLADEFGPMPPMRPAAIGTGAGGKDPATHANVTRLVVGAATAGTPVEAAVVLEANIDDMDPRLWPGVLDKLLNSGASDAWLVPILMKKGRPAHTLRVLAEPGRSAALERVILTHTTTIGLRRVPVEKVVLDREWQTVTVPWGEVRVKVARLDGVVVNAEPEYEDVAALADRAGVPAKVVLAAARGALR